ncbi:nitrogen regulation protein NR(II) [Roseateles sp. BYS78W]|uniref:histidine kinase n=1 Tax=Pelomonas candidula TaxID=3299025 RepID=A0ABW7H8J7_9BURK
MTLRRALLLAFMLLGLVPAIALSWLSFSRTRDVMSQRIAANLDAQAAVLQEQLDRMLAEHLHNALAWRRSELMRDLRLGDVDKRVLNDLHALREGYPGQYDRLECIDAGGRIVASTEAARNGRPDDGAEHRIATDLGRGARLLSPAGGLVNERQSLALEVDIPPPPGESVSPGRLRLELAALPLLQSLRNASQGQLTVLLLRAQGGWVAAEGLPAAARLASPELQAETQALALQALQTGDGAQGEWRWLGEPVIAGAAASRQMAGLAGARWVTLLIQPRDEALAPVRGMGRIFVGLLAAVALATVLAATLMTTAIARPILALTEATRRFRGEDGATPEQPRAGIAELDELGQAHADMVRAVQRSRDQLVRSAKLAMLGELAAVMAHEVRTPLGVLRSSAQLLEREPGLGADSRELLGLMRSETERLNRLVTTLLDTARPRAPRFAPCDVHQVLERCQQLQLARQADAAQMVLAPARLELDLGARAPVFQGDEEQLLQVALNLVQNALRAAGSGGRVLLSARDAPDLLTVACDDDGPGVPPDIADRLFDPFVTRGENGIGLGLAVVQQLVQAHGGSIRVLRSALGGSRFEFTLPRRQIPAPMPDDPA